MQKDAQNNMDGVCKQGGSIKENEDKKTNIYITKKRKFLGDIMRNITRNIGHSQDIMEVMRTEE